MTYIWSNLMAFKNKIPPLYANFTRLYMDSNNTLVCGMIIQLRRLFTSALHIVSVTIPYSSTNIKVSPFFSLVYVDDILIIGSSSVLILKLVDSLNEKYALKKLGCPMCFIGIEIKWLSYGFLLLTQTNYICDLLNHVNMNHANGVSMPMLTSCKLSRHDANTLSEPRQYMLIVGAL